MVNGGMMLVHPDTSIFESMASLVANGWDHVTNKLRWTYVRQSWLITIQLSL